MESLLYELHLGLLSLWANPTEDKCHPLAGPESEIRGCILGFLSQGNAGIQRHRRTRIARWRKNRIPLFEVHRVFAPRIVETGLTPHLEIELSPDHRHCADNLVRLLSVCPNGHVVSQFCHAFLRKKSREQNVRVWKIQLPDPPFFE